MKKLISYNIIFLIFSHLCIAQEKVSGFVYDDATNNSIPNVAIYDSNSEQVYYTDKSGYFELNKNTNTSEIIFFIEGYVLLSKELSEDNKNLNIRLSSRVEQLNEVVVRANKKKIFQIRRMKDFEETSVFAGKKNEVILLELSMANLASNNARQIYNQIPGLNIYQNDDAGLQLNIGGRGLDPNRTSNFNTRQNLSLIHI